MSRVAGDACSRAARKSVQRSLPFVVVACPSVSESPTTAIAAACGTASTSIPETWYQWSIVCAPGRSAAPGKSPCTKYVVSREPGCPVSTAGGSSR